MAEALDHAARDAGMIAAAQPVEHDEITRCGTMVTREDRRGPDKPRHRLDETLEQEKAADGRLAGRSLNKKAARGGGPGRPRLPARG